MSFKPRYFCVLLLFSFVLISCNPPPETPRVVTQQEVIADGLAERTVNNLDIRVDWIEIGENVGDLAGKGELTLQLLVIRENGDSRAMVAPGISSYKVDGNDHIPLDGFSMTVNSVGQQEHILVYVIAIESDELDFASQTGASVAIDGAIFALEQELDTIIGSTVIAGKAISHASLLGFILGAVSGGVLDWWQEAEIIGGYGVLLGPQNNWQANLGHEGISDDQNLILHYSILPQMDVDAREDVLEADEIEPNNEAVIIPSPMPTERVLQATATPRPLPTATPRPLPTVTSAPVSPITRFILVNADTDQDLFTLSNNSQVVLSSLSTNNLDIRAEVNANWVKSVVFLLDGNRFEMNGRDVENSAPYSMAGDINGDYYNTWNWGNMIGSHTISAKACSEQFGAGNCSQLFTISISVSN